MEGLRDVACPIALGVLNALAGVLPTTAPRPPLHPASLALCGLCRTSPEWTTAACRPRLGLHVIGWTLVELSGGSIINRASTSSVYIYYIMNKLSLIAY